MQPRNEEDWDPGPVPRRVPAGSRREIGKHGDTKSDVTTAATTSELRRRYKELSLRNDTRRHGAEWKKDVALGYRSVVNI
ncbi:hypothetical protein NEUTE1DRAFT_100493 [Neurospora tetrasperma FGSC 2508]|uniref:Uncharacterized protein n=1 Tax=Neurospora tetrasperma (strain FGSC 2508 / ATCC MYA-4615 / P0657) TaxID=510951 RepID=F8MLG9_NEUT8|nr:uncharacterized protein NEUTE1DRAFT_100493 [Neurospora tetrasperma FGSC 2508]EGO57591.1 hypothetical protein NEUTE1DRAFT_100493 [Neurospora tetrasperma FGSC 2508]